ncbi:MAG TPA: bacillithiol biosynthesis BshC, partial [Thermoanaerobaculia bacterium]|nr:bacillithiol biosynthesis BshC [Thermoanaerobaculia bacterium]
MSDSGCLRIPLTQYPGFNKFVLDWLGGDQRFLKRAAHPGPLPARGERVPKAGEGPPLQLVDALIESNKRWGSFVGPEVRRWAAGETVTLVAGQQVGFAGGPLYTLAKIATLLKMRRELEARGAPATVFFWLATEDHDFNEVATLALPAQQGAQLDLVHVRATRAVESHAAVGPLPIPEPLIAELLGVLQMDRPQWLRPGITFRDSFAELLATVLADQKVIFIDALLPELRAAGAPLFSAIAERWDDVQRAVSDRSAALAAAGYTPQVVPREEGEDYTLFFTLDDNGNRVPYNRKQPPPPERTSTSAITRPLLQDAVIRPDVFVGGPAEVAYYAQLAPLYDLLGLRMPRVALRGHALVAPKRIIRIFERFAIDPRHLFTGADALLAEREPAGVAEVRRIAQEARTELAEKMTRIGEIALPAEHALARAINRSIGHIEYHFGKLTERAIRGLARKDRERYAAVRELVATLYP